MRYPIALPGFDGQFIEVERAGFSGKIQVFSNGQTVPPGPKKHQFVLQRTNGEQVVATIKPSVDPIPMVQVEGQTYRLAEPMKWYEWVWCGLPLIAIAFGGALGGGLGGAGYVINVQLFRNANLSPVARYGVTLAVTIGMLLLLVLIQAAIFKSL